MAEQYKKPYLDSTVFLDWIKNEPEKDRGRIAEHILKMAEQGVFQIYTSALTIAEVHKRKKGPTLTSEENGRILRYFENEFVQIIEVDRSIGEEANELCRKHAGLSPNDAIHMACARRAGCDVLLSWDDTMNQIKDFDVRMEEPQIIGQPTLALKSPPQPLLEARNANSKEKV